MLGYVDIQTPTPSHVVALGALGAIVVVFLLTLGLPRMLEWMGIWRTRWTRGVCGRCGYSRRGLDGTICPECGADVKVVGEKVRQGQSWRRILIVCGCWVGVVWLAGESFRYAIGRYWLRLHYGLDYDSKWSLLPNPAARAEIGYWHHAVVWGVAVIGCTMIVVVARRGKKVC